MVFFLNDNLAISPTDRGCDRSWSPHHHTLKHGLTSDLHRFGSIKTI
jgi:hypothetical protein